MSLGASRRVLVVGAGFSGAVVARELAEAGRRVLVFEQREHVAGHCHTERDAATGIMQHVHGPHIFHTSNREVWEYVQRFATMAPYVSRVKASLGRGVFSLPINLHTINQFFGRRFRPEEAREFIRAQGEQAIGEPQNFEEQALKMMGRELYEAFFYGYTRKQWGCEPRELSAEILKRLPIRFSYDDNYYESRYQGIPVEGYTALVQRILDHPLIEVRLKTNWEYAVAQDPEFDAIFYTGALDAFFAYRLGRLGYRTVFWEKTQTMGDYQGTAIINYPELHDPQTRVHEHKHFAPWEEHRETIVFTEFSRETGVGDVPYYPKRLPHDRALFARYQALAQAEEKVRFLGRLATYRYLDMHVVIAEALAMARAFLQSPPGPAQPRSQFAGTIPPPAP